MENLSLERSAIACVGDEDTVIGLRLAGVKKAEIVNDPKKARKKILEFAENEEIGVLILTEKIVEENRDIVNALLEKPFPIIVEIPSSEGPIKKEKDTLKELVRKAVGIDLNI